MTTATATRFASDKQVALIAKLAVEKDLGTDADFNLLVANSANLDVRAASSLIDTLFALPRKAQVVADNVDGAPISEGFFLVADDVYRVVASKSGNLYAKRFVCDGGRASYDYAPGALRLLANAVRLTLEDAAAIGAKFGTCVFCARTLTDEVSIAQGYGPICASKYA